MIKKNTGLLGSVEYEIKLRWKTPIYETEWKRVFVFRKTRTITGEFIRFRFAYQKCTATRLGIIDVFYATNSLDVLKIDRKDYLSDGTLVDINLIREMRDNKKTPFKEIV